MHNMTLGKVEGSVEAIRAAMQKLDGGGNLEDAKAVCEPGLLNQITKFRTKLKVYLSPFLYGSRYTYFGRHFTNAEKLQEAFYLPGFIDVDEKQMDDWNVCAPPLHLWSHRDWTIEHKEIALQRGHLPDVQEIQGCHLQRQFSGQHQEPCDLYRDLSLQDDKQLQAQERGYGSYPDDRIARWNCMNSEEHYFGVGNRRQHPVDPGFDFRDRASAEPFVDNPRHPIGIAGQLYGREADMRAQGEFYGHQHPAFVTHAGNHLPRPPFGFSSTYRQLGYFERICYTEI